MKISDFIFRSSTSRLTGNDAICRVRLFAGIRNKAFVVLTDLGEKNTGASVTNSVEHITSQLINQGFITKENIVLEHDALSGKRSRAQRVIPPPVVL